MKGDNIGSLLLLMWPMHQLPGPECSATIMAFTT